MVKLIHFYKGAERMFDFTAYMPTRLLLGKKSIDQFPQVVKSFGNKALLVTGKRSMKESGFTDRAIRKLSSVGIEVELFDEVQSNPTMKAVNEGGALARKASVDMVIGLGGGSALDSAKAIAVLAKYGGSIWDFIEGKEIDKPVLPIICLPSTAGTGSEVTKYAVISNEKARLKEGFASNFIFPAVAVLDPELMSTVPHSLTVKAGGDVLAHAIEAYLTKLANPYSDIVALESIRLCVKYLKKVAKNGKNLKNRTAMGWASSLAGIAISFVDVVIGHHVSEAVGALYRTHHGETAALLLPYAMEFNFEGTKERLTHIAEVMGVDIKGMSVDEAALKSIEAVRSLLKEIGIPEKLRDLGVGKKEIPKMLEILKKRVPDLKAGNHHEITIESIKQYIEMAL